MLEFYRGHLIFVLIDQMLTAEMSLYETRFPLPTKVSATFEEGERVLMQRARALIDLYSQRPEAASGQDVSTTLSAEAPVVNAMHATWARV